MKKDKAFLFSICKVGALLLALIPLLANDCLAAEVKVKNGEESAVKLPDYMHEYCRIATPALKSSTAIYSETSLPRILLTGSENPRVFLHAGTKLVGFDYDKKKLSDTVLDPGMEITQILSSPQDSKIIVLAGSKISLLNMTSGKIEMTKDAGLISGYFFHSRGVFGFPIRVSHLPGNKFMLRALILKSRKLLKSAKYANSEIIIDPEDGRVSSEREFHFRRMLSPEKEIFIDADTGEFEIFDSGKMQVALRGKLDMGDLLFEKDYTAVDKSRLDESLALFGKEFCGCILDNGFMLNSRDCYAGLYGGIKQSKWVFYDQAGNRTKTVDPAPLTAVDFRVANIGKSQWPLYLLHHMHRSGRRTRVDKIIALQSDGSWSGVELPKIEGINEFLLMPEGRWFHDGDTFYYTNGGNLYRFKSGEKSGEILFQADKSDGCESVEFFNSKFLVLTNSNSNYGQRDAILVRLADGSKVKPEDYNESLQNAIWKLVVDYNQSGKPLPKADAASGIIEYKRYSCTRDFQGVSKIVNKINPWESGFGVTRLFLMFKVWGDYGKEGPYFDIGIVPAVLRDKSSALVGINLSDNRAVFTIPVMEFSKLPVDENDPIFPEGNYLPFNVLRLNEKEALLIVFEKIDLIKVYKISRPA